MLTMKFLFLRSALVSALLWQSSLPALAQRSAAPVMADGEKARLLQQLKSPIWTEQLEAAQKVLQSGHAADIARLEAFATHPFFPLRCAAAQAMVHKQKFSPALKTLFYQGADLNWEPDSAGDYALATLALSEVEHEAREGGYTGKGLGQPYSLYDIHDPRIGDLLATRLQNHDAYGVKLFHLSGLPDDFLKSGDDPLSPDLKAKVLAAWKLRSPHIKNPFTEAGLQTEMALVRQIRYNNFEKGPFYDEVVSIVNDGEKLDFLASADMGRINVRIAALPKAAAPTLFRVLKWHGLYNPPNSALQLLAGSGDPGAFVQLAQVAYGQYSGESRVEAIHLLAKLDFKRARPHLEAFVKRSFVPGNWNTDAPRLGAAVALAEHGEKSAVPAFFTAPSDSHITSIDERDFVSALRASTGLSFSTVEEWRSWWTNTGSKMNWK